jgi:hypothetical protein
MRALSPEKRLGFGKWVRRPERILSLIAVLVQTAKPRHIRREYSFGGRELGC